MPQLRLSEVHRVCHFIVIKGINLPRVAGKLSCHRTFDANLEESIASAHIIKPQQLAAGPQIS